MGPNITRTEVLAKYWELANLDPKETKGSITGQLHALELLSEELKQQGQAGPPKAKIFQSEWMLEK